MASRQRIPDDKRQAIADAIRAGGKRNEIARDFHVSPGTVSNIATEFELDQAFDRTATVRASAAKRADNAARRAVESEACLEEMAATRPRFRGSSDQLLVNGNIVTMDLPPARDLRDLAIAYQALAKTHIELDKHDSARGHDDAKSMLVDIAEGLRAFQQAKDQAG
jgi:transposase-like protein